jgi:glycosyltransferase involved in cell wall biosynthesis
MIRLSIIIPFYNVEKYIAQCLQSIYNQDITEEEYEVICVNDCSPDSSREIVLEFQAKHRNLILLEQPTNQKLGAARNRAIREACGKYVWFIDSDDFIEENCLKKLLNILEINDLEILNFNFVQYINDDKLNKIYGLSQDTDVISGVEFMNSIIIVR